ncbi:MAG: hypothetical protein DAHOPDDO_03428 [Ignavibacteriaceae bacterium]|nr:hypothetical protein [Ignavibacteriaceae bacterium]
MKNIFYYLVIIIAAFSISLNAQWMQIGPPGGRVLSLAVNGSNIYAGTAYGVYSSTNNGQSWVETSMNVVRSLAVNDSNVFAGIGGFMSYPQGVYRSTDNGQNWTQTAMNYDIVQSLAVRDSQVFAGTTYSGLYRSTDGGQN